MKFCCLLSRYVSRSFLGSFGSALLCLLSIIVIFDFAEINRRAGSQEVCIISKFTMVLLRAPHILEQALPSLVFIAAIFAFLRMNRTNELVIFRATGVSLWRLILPISLTAFFIGCMSITVLNPLSSAMLARYEKLEKKYLSQLQNEIKIESTGLWLSERIGPNQAIYRVSQIDLKKLEFTDINIIIISPQNKFLERIDAQSARIKGDHLELTNGWDTLSGKAAQPFSQKSIETSLSRKKIEITKASTNTISFWQLPSYISLLNTSGLKSLRYLTYWYSLISSAFWLGAMVLLAAAFSCRPFRQGKTILMILIGLITGFFLYFFKDITFALGASGRLPPIIAAWLPLFLTLMIGATLVFSQEDG